MMEATVLFLYSVSNQLALTNRFRLFRFTCWLFPVLLAQTTTSAQQSNVNLDWRPHLNVEKLTPFSAPVNSPEVLNDQTVVFRLKAPEAKK